MAKVRNVRRRQARQWAMRMREYRLGLTARGRSAETLPPSVWSRRFPGRSAMSARRWRKFSEVYRLNRKRAV